MVHGSAAHPAEAAIGSKRALLEDGWRSTRASDFVPANTGAGSSRYGVVYHKRFMVAEVAIGQTIHQAISQRVQLLVGSQLRNTSAAAGTSSRKSCNRQIGGTA